MRNNTELTKEEIKTKVEMWFLNEMLVTKSNSTPNEISRRLRIGEIFYTSLPNLYAVEKIASEVEELIDNKRILKLNNLCVKLGINTTHQANMLCVRNEVCRIGALGVSNVLYIH